jgi:hypothetical protein
MFQLYGDPRVGIGRTTWMSKLAAESYYGAGDLLLFAPVFDIIGRRFHRSVFIIMGERAR